MLKTTGRFGSIGSAVQIVADLAARDALGSVSPGTQCLVESYDDAGDWAFYIYDQDQWLTVSSGSWPSPPPPPINGPRIALIGDSITQYGNNAGNLSSTLTRDTNGIVSVPAPAHNLISGESISMVNINDPTFEGVYTATVVDGDNFTYQTSVTGNPTTIAAVNGLSAVVKNRHFGPNSYFVWLNSLCAGGLRFIANAGAVGDTAANMTNLTTIVAARTDVDIICIQAGTNDLNASSTADQIIGYLTALVNIALAGGKRVVIADTPPAGASYSSSDFETKRLAISAGLVALEAANPGLVAHANTYPLLVDPESDIGEAYSDVTVDGLHFTAAGARRAAPAWKAAFDKIATYDNVFTSPSLSGHTLLKSYQSPTGADVGSKSNVTGQISLAGGAVNSNARTVAVAEVFNDPDRGGYCQRFTITPGGADSVSVYLGSTNGETTASLGVAAGDSLILAAEIRVSGGSGTLAFSQMNISTPSGSGMVGWTILPGTTGQDNLGDFDAVFASEPFVIQTGQTKVGNVIGVMFAAAGATSCIVEIGRVWLLRKAA